MTDKPSAGSVRIAREIALKSDLFADCAGDRVQVIAQFIDRGGVRELVEALEAINSWLLCAPVASTQDFMSGVVSMHERAEAALRKWRKP